MNHNPELRCVICTGVTLFAPVLHFLHWCYTRTALLSANQNRVIFSCILLVQLQIALWSRAHASLVHPHGTWNFQKLSSWKASLDFMISRAMKSHTNEHTVRGTPTLKVVKRFPNGSVCKAYERSIYERTFWVNLSRIMLYQRCPKGANINRG